MENPRDYRYTREHEWVRLDGDIAVMGITSYAATHLSDITFVEDMPEVGDNVTQGEVAGTIESVKSASDFNSPVSGQVIGRNEQLLNRPELFNADPYGEGWYIKVRPSNPSELDNLMSAEDYDEFEKAQS